MAVEWSPPEIAINGMQARSAAQSGGKLTFACRCSQLPSVPIFSVGQERKQTETKIHFRRAYQ
jgi:hypothetical protein